jgi:Tfp pilus assembly protein FimT
MVTLVVGMVAVIALPAGTNSLEARIDAAAGEVAAAVRFARDESIRTGVAHGVRQQTGSNQVQVFRIDGAGVLIFDIYQPVAKQLWDIQFDTSPNYHGVVIDRTTDWRAVCNEGGNIAFRGDGTPTCTDPDTTLLEQGLVTVTLDNLRRDVAVDGFTGRVWVQ